MAAEGFASLSSVSTSQDGSTLDLGVLRRHHAMFVDINGSLGTSVGSATVSLEVSWDGTNWIGVASESANSSNFLASPALLTYDGAARYVRASLNIPTPTGGGSLSAYVASL